MTRGSAGGLVAATSDEEPLTFRPIETVAALDAALGEARAAGQPVMLDFTAEWCISCKEMEEYTFPDSGVIGALGSFMLLRADVTDNNDDDKALLQRFKSFGPPTIAFFDRSGFERTNFKLVGFVPAENSAIVGGPKLLKRWRRALSSSLLSVTSARNSMNNPSAPMTPESGNVYSSISFAGDTPLRPGLASRLGGGPRLGAPHRAREGVDGAKSSCSSSAVQRPARPRSRALLAGSAAGGRRRRAWRRSASAP